MTAIDQIISRNVMDVTLRRSFHSSRTLYWRPQNCPRFPARSPVLLLSRSWSERVSLPSPRCWSNWREKNSERWLIANNPHLNTKKNGPRNFYTPTWSRHGCPGLPGWLWTWLERHIILCRCRVDGVLRMIIAAGRTTGGLSLCITRVVWPMKLDVNSIYIQSSCDRGGMLSLVWTSGNNCDCEKWLWWCKSSETRLWGSHQGASSFRFIREGCTSNSC